MLVSAKMVESLRWALHKDDRFSLVNNVFGDAEALRPLDFHFAYIRGSRYFACSSWRVELKRFESGLVLFHLLCLGSKPSMNSWYLTRLQKRQRLLLPEGSPAKLVSFGLSSHALKEEFSNRFQVFL